ncbi:MAG TPA: sigma-70 family RNA polymerase sigma factor [Acidimicrobiales bacterium]|nr:sigma-70 family RNA polymerase sigma factor [Acidimicrobiales bacterium]
MATRAADGVGIPDGRRTRGIEGRPRGDAAEIAALVCRARAGDRGALAQIVDRCTPMVRAIAHRYVSNPADVEDVVQDAWLSLVEHLHSIRSPAATRAWLVQVTTHAAWRNRRKVLRAAPDAELDERAADDDTAEAGLGHVWCEQLRQPLAQAVRALRPDHRHLIELLTADEPPDYRAAGKLLDRPIGSIGPTRQRVLERLRRQPALARYMDACELAAAAAS